MSALSTLTSVGGGGQELTLVINSECDLKKLASRTGLGAHRACCFASAWCSSSHAAAAAASTSHLSEYVFHRKPFGSLPSSKNSRARATAGWR